MKKKVLMGYIKTQESFIKLVKVMKANETPEKIYIPKNDTLELGLEDFWIDHRVFVSDIEYTHTNAFIEKACEFFGEYLCEYIDVKNANCDTFVNIDGDKLKEDFRKYMGGE